MLENDLGKARSHSLGSHIRTHTGTKPQNHTHMKKKGQALPIAFKQMLSETGIWKKLRLSKQTVMNRRVQVGKGFYPKDTTMRAWLKKAGWKLETVETWTLR